MRKTLKALVFAFCVLLTVGAVASCKKTPKAKTKLDAPEVASKTYTGNKLTADIQETDLYTVIDEGGTDVGSYDVVLTLKNPSAYEWKNPDEDDATKVTLTFKITKATNDITDFTMNDRVYGEMANEPTATAKFGNVTFTYSDSRDGEYVSERPENVGDYYVKASVVGTDNYGSVEKSLAFSITKATNEITDFTMNGWVFGETANEPTATARFGNVIFTYADSLDGEFVSAKPTKVGNYYVKATVVGTDNYGSVEKILAFSITSAEGENPVEEPKAGGNV